MNNQIPRFKRPKDITLGDIVKGHGIITKIDLEDTNPLFNAPHWFYFDYNDPHFGQSGCEIDLEKLYELITAKSQRIKIYKTVREELTEALIARADDLRILKPLLEDE